MEVIWTLQNSETTYDSNLAIQCAILHDVIEDTEFTYQDIKIEFGENVANGVLALTKEKSILLKDQQMKDSLKRIKHQPYEIWIVKMADRISNLYHPPFYWKKEKMVLYKEELF